MRTSRFLAPLFLLSLLAVAACSPAGLSKPARSEPSASPRLSPPPHSQALVSAHIQVSDNPVPFSGDVPRSAASYAPETCHALASDLARPGAIPLVNGVQVNRHVLELVVNIPPKVFTGPGDYGGAKLVFRPVIVDGVTYTPDPASSRATLKPDGSGTLSFRAQSRADTKARLTVAMSWTCADL